MVYHEVEYRFLLFLFLVLKENLPEEVSFKVKNTEYRPAMSPAFCGRLPQFEEKCFLENSRILAFVTISLV